MPIQPGDVVIVEFPGADGVKRRPAVVVSTTIYHSTRPDVILGLLTSQISPSGAGPTDYVLNDWSASGLRVPSMVRAFLATMPASAVIRVGRLSDGDWKQVREKLRTGLAVD